MKSNHYTHSLYYKLLIGYLIFGLLGFITIATISSEMTYHHLVERESEVLYDEATMIADRCSKAYEGKTINLDSAYPQIEAVSAYLQSDIWILNHEGTIVADSSDSRTGIAIDDFDPTAQGNRLYSIGQYYNLFDSKVLSVSAPITGNMKTYGYIVIHMPIQNIEAEPERISEYYLHNIDHPVLPIPGGASCFYKSGLFPAQKDYGRSQ